MENTIQKNIQKVLYKYMDTVSTILNA